MPAQSIADSIVSSAENTAAPANALGLTADEALQNGYGTGSLFQELSEFHGTGGSHRQSGHRHKLFLF